MSGDGARDWLDQSADPTAQTMAPVSSSGTTSGPPSIRSTTPATRIPAPATATVSPTMLPMSVGRRDDVFSVGHQGGRELGEEPRIRGGLPVAEVALEVEAHRDDLGGRRHRQELHLGEIHPTVGGPMGPEEVPVDLHDPVSLEHAVGRVTVVLEAHEVHRSVGSVRCLNAATGEVIWSTTIDEGARQSPVVVHGVLFTSTRFSHVVAIDVSNGTLIWSRDIEGQGGSPVVVDDAGVTHYPGESGARN